MKKNKNNVVIKFPLNNKKEINIETYKEFSEYIKSGKTPSQAIKEIISDYRINHLDQLILFGFLRESYADICIMNLSNAVVDSNYPNRNCTMTDEEFDSLVKEAIIKGDW